MKFLNMKLMIVFVIALPMFALASNKRIHCTQNPEEIYLGQASFALSQEQFTSGSQYAHITSVFWGYQFSSAQMICNDMLIDLKIKTNIICLGFVLGGRAQLSGEIGENGGTIRFHNIDSSNAYAKQTEGLVLNCKIEETE